MSLNIQDDSIFIADAHYSEVHKEFENFLVKVLNKEIKSSQIFLMGDMIDFISGESSYFIKKNEKIIHLLNEISKETQLIYLEGNHDYNLKIIFPLIKVYKREEQPIQAKIGDKNVKLSHGDIFVNDKFYDIYCKIIRNSQLLKFLNLLDINHFISKKIYYGLLHKNICTKIENFEDIARRKVQSYNTDIIIEGHYHQDKIYIFDEKMYINVPSLACSKSYLRLKNKKFIGEELE